MFAKNYKKQFAMMRHKNHANNNFRPLAFVYVASRAAKIVGYDLCVLYCFTSSKWNIYAVDEECMPDSQHIQTHFTSSQFAYFFLSLRSLSSAKLRQPNGKISRLLRNCCFQELLNSEIISSDTMNKNDWVTWRATEWREKKTFPGRGGGQGVT